MRIDRRRAAETCACVKCEHYGSQVFTKETENILKSVHKHFRERVHEMHWCDLAYNHAQLHDSFVFSYQILALNESRKQIEFTNEWKEIRGLVGCGNKDYFELPPKCPFELEHLMRKG